MFGDTSLLRRDRAINLIDGCEREVPASHHEVGGIPCDDASALNPDGNRRDSEHRSCVAAGSLRTGNVLHDVVHHLIRHVGTLKFLILENVSHRNVMGAWSAVRRQERGLQAVQAVQA